MFIDIFLHFFISFKNDFQVDELKRKKCKDISASMV